MLVIFGFGVVLANFVVFLVDEKETKSKHIQFVSGVHATSYWLANFLWDSCVLLIVISMSTIIIAAFQTSAFSAGEPLTAIVIAMVRPFILLYQYHLTMPACMAELTIY